jgi:protoporphyrinogen oxidase
MSTSISRATFLKGLGALAAAGLCGTTLVQLLKKSRPQFPCRMLGPSKELGHLLRDNAALARVNSGRPQEAPAQDPARELALARIQDSAHAPALVRIQGSAKAPALADTNIPLQGVSQRCKIAIVGGGMAGLSAAWWLRKNGIDDVVLLELEKNVGGNSASGKNQFGSYPWGAHYIPIPNSESVYVRALLEELKILQSYNEAGQPIYDELMLCHEPQERLYKDGAFHEGLVPKRGLQGDESADIARFFGMMVDFRKAIGNDGKIAFAIPLDLSSQDAAYTSLDKLSMGQWLKEHSFKTRPLLWYVNYCCRDDYGSTVENVSAWAGIHYFAGRRGTAANAEQNAVLTWPQGNGYLVEQLRMKLIDLIRTDTLVTQVQEAGHNVHIRFVDPAGKHGEVFSDFVIFAAPRFVARHVVADAKFQSSQTATLNYAPWMVANVTVKGLPSSRGAAPAWDNVSYYSDSLGYVMADHQDITTRPKVSVITYYYPLSQNTPKTSRQELYKATPEQWREIIVKDLEKMHPDIEDQILSIDLWPWGHGMIRPDVGFIWGDSRKQMKAAAGNAGNIVFAHSDMSGMSNFEEAQYHGIEAAKSVMEKMRQS